MRWYNRVFKIGLLSLLFLSIFKPSHSQIRFESGYFLNDSGVRTECFIKNMGWSDNPFTFEYRVEEGREIETASIDSIMEFVIYDRVRYKRFSVDIIRSSDNISYLDVNDTMRFNREELFLKEIIESSEGGASLYSYKDGELHRFFYRIGNMELKPLIYRRFTVDTYYVHNNDYYKQQLLNDFRHCPELKTTDFERLRYAENDLRKIFKKYNTCVGTAYIDLEYRKASEIINIWVKPGISYSSLGINNQKVNHRMVDFGYLANFRLGAEIEWVLPANGNKWSIFIDPAISSYLSSKEVVYLETWMGDLTTTVNVDYRYAEIPLGVRYNIYLGEFSKIFFSANVSPKVRINDVISSGVDYIFDLEIMAPPSIDLGTGFNFNDKLRLEIRHSLRQNIVLGTYWASSYHNYSLTLGINLF